MNVSDVLGISLNSVSERKFRFALNLIGILIGCAAVGGLISITEGMRDDIQAQIMGFGPTVINVYVERSGRYSDQWLDWRDLRTIQEIEGVEAATPMDFAGGFAYKAQGRYYYTGVNGISHEYFSISGNWNLIEGRFLTRSDKGAAVVTNRFMQPTGVDEPLFELGDRVRVTYMKNGMEEDFMFRIVGVIEEQASGFGSDPDTVMYIPIRTFEQLIDMKGRYHLIKVRVEDIDMVQQVADEIKRKLKYTGTFTMDMLMEQLNQIMGTINGVLGGIAGISLIVAGVSIVNTMTISVMERTKEIGTMKAIGAKRLDVMSLFMTEAFITGVIGGIFGAILGFILSYAVSIFTELPSSVSPLLGLLIVGFAMVTCVLSGIHPAWRASNLNPVEALRHE
jgi:putative ABC transport system permease protein